MKYLLDLNIYDGYVFSIDENFLTETDVINFKQYKNYKLRFSIVITKDNYEIFDREWIDEVCKKTGIASMTFRPNVFSDFDYFNNFMELGNFDNYVLGEQNAVFIPYQNKFITFWDNKTINQNVMYLWSDGNISNNCEWKKLYK